MGKKHDHIMRELWQLGRRIEKLEWALNPFVIVSVPVEGIGATEYGHKCKFMPPGFMVAKYIPDGWRLRYDDDDVPAPLINFCPYCGLKLCEPEVP